jgi:rubrerythrin
MDVLNSEIVTLMKEAMRLEMKGRNFFLHAASITDNALGRKMFEKLASDEIEHMKVFSDLFTAATGGDEWRKVVKAEEEEGSAVIDHLKTRIKNIEKEKGAGDLEALRIGMELERKAIEFFTSLSAGSVSPEAKEIAGRICEQERRHYDLLQAQYDSVNNSGFWLDSAEFRLDGEY